MNYYKQGDAANAKKIKAAFEKLGYNTGNLAFTSSQLYYTIEGKVKLMCTKSLQNIVKTHPDYQELELPVEPKFKVRDWIVRGEGFVYEEDYKTGSWLYVSHIHPATKEQWDLLFKKMKEAGYEWNAEKKELRKIQHYDISTFKPKQWVLVRDDDEWEWVLTRFSHLSNGSASLFVCINGASFQQCIPFKGNEHLLGTTNMPDEMFINW